MFYNIYYKSSYPIRHRKVFLPFLCAKTEIALPYCFGMAVRLAVLEVRKKEVSDVGSREGARCTVS